MSRDRRRGAANGREGGREGGGTPQLLQRAVECHRAGRFAEAEALYRRVLQRRPDHPDRAGICCNLGSVLRQQGHPAEAAAAFRDAVAADPALVEAQFNLGNALKDLGRLDAAEAAYRQAIALRPDLAEAHYNLGNTLRQQGRLDAAEAAYRQAVALKPGFAAAHNNLGNVLKAQDALAEAEAAFRRALDADPGFAEAHSNLGNVLRDRDRPAEAEAAFRRALALRPDYAEAAANLGGLLRQQGDAAGAAAALERALALDPAAPETHSTLAAALLDLGRPAEAAKHCRAALAQRPGFADARFNQGMVLLAQGNLAEGWAGYDARWQADRRLRHLRRPFPQPLWDGSPLAGRTLLVWGEQGVGDEILFASVLPDAVAAARRCLIECDARLVALFTRSFPAAEILPRTDPPHPQTALPGIDVQLPSGSLARWFRSSLDRFPERGGYLRADPVQVARWRARLRALGPGPKVGVSWRSGRVDAFRAQAYAALEDWQEVLAVPGAMFVNLQYDDCAAELAAVRNAFGVTIHAFGDIDLRNDLDGAAALTAALDLVIAPGTAVAAMAGALGVPTWQFAWDRYSLVTLGTERCPWQPSLRCFFRPAGSAAWEPVMAAIAAALHRLIAEDAGPTGPAQAPPAG